MAAEDFKNKQDTGLSEQALALPTDVGVSMVPEASQHSPVCTGSPPDILLLFQ